MTYRYLPSTSELLDALKVPRKSAMSDKWVRSALWIALSSFFVVLVCVGFFYLRLFEKEMLQRVALSFLGITAVAGFVMMLRGVQNLGLFQNPAKGMALQIDAEAEVEFQFMKKVGQIPAAVLLERHHYLEAQLAKRDKWLDVMRFMAIIVTSVLVLSISLIGKGGISSGVEVAMYSLLTGFSFGAVLVRVGSADLQRLSFRLKRMGERLQADQVRRQSRNRRR